MLFEIRLTRYHSEEVGKGGDREGDRKDWDNKVLSDINRYNFPSEEYNNTIET